MSMTVAKVADAQRQQELFETIRQLNSTRDERAAQDAPNHRRGDAEEARKAAIGVNAVTGEISPDYAAMASFLMSAATSGPGGAWSGGATGAAQAMGDYRETVENPDPDAARPVAFGADGVPQDPVMWLESALERFVDDLNGAKGLDLRALASALWEAMARTDRDGPDEASNQGTIEGRLAAPPGTLADLQMDLREALIAYLGDGARPRAQAP